MMKIITNNWKKQIVWDKNSDRGQSDFFVFAKTGVSVKEVFALSPVFVTGMQTNHPRMAGVEI